MQHSPYNPPRALPDDHQKYPQEDCRIHTGDRIVEHDPESAMDPFDSSYGKRLQYIEGAEEEKPGNRTLQIKGHETHRDKIADNLIDNYLPWVLLLPEMLTLGRTPCP